MGFLGNDNHIPKIYTGKMQLSHVSEFDFQLLVFVKETFIHFEFISCLYKNFRNFQIDSNPKCKNIAF